MRRYGRVGAAEEEEAAPDVRARGARDRFLRMRAQINNAGLSRINIAPCSSESIMLSPNRVIKASYRLFATFAQGISVLRSSIIAVGRSAIVAVSNQQLVGLERKRWNEE